MSDDKIKELVNSLKKESSRTFEQRCKRFFYDNSYEYRSLDQKNRDFIINFLKKYRDDLVRYGGVPAHKMRRDLSQVRSQLSDNELSRIDYQNLVKISKHFQL